MKREEINSSYNIAGWRIKSLIKYLYLKKASSYDSLFSPIPSGPGMLYNSIQFKSFIHTQKKSLQTYKS